MDKEQSDPESVIIAELAPKSTLGQILFYDAAGCGSDSLMPLMSHEGPRIVNFEVVLRSDSTFHGWRGDGAFSYVLNEADFPFHPWVPIPEAKKVLKRKS